MKTAGEHVVQHDKYAFIIGTADKAAKGLAQFHPGDHFIILAASESFAASFV